MVQFIISTLKQESEETVAIGIQLSLSNLSSSTTQFLINLIGGIASHCPNALNIWRM